MSLHERIRRAMDTADLSQSEVERRMGRSKGYLSRVFTRGASPTEKSLLPLAQVTGVRVEWLMTGEGSMRARDPSETDSPELTAVLASPRAARWSEETIAGVRAFAARSSERMSEEDIEALGRAIEGQRSMMGRPVTHDPVEEHRRKRR